MWFDSWSGLGRVLAVGALAYALLVVFLRVSGKRTLSKLNAFDLVVTVAMGSTLSAVLLDDGIPLAEGATAFLVLIAAQYAVAWLSVRWPGLGHLVRSEPRLLLHNGELLHDALRLERVMQDEVLAAIRSAGMARVEEVGAVVLESDGTLNVLPRLKDQPTSLADVSGRPDRPAAGESAGS